MNFTRVVRYCLLLLWLSFTLIVSTTPSSIASPLPPQPTDQPIFDSSSSSESSSRPFILKDHFRCAEVTEQMLYREALKVAGKAPPKFLSWKSPDVIARALVSSAAFAYGSWAEGKTTNDVVILGVTSFVLSYAFWVATPVYSDWLEHRGVFKMIPESKVGFVENWLKEYSMQWLYLGIYHLVAYMIGATDELMSWALLATVNWSWLSEGSWSLVIAKKKREMVKRLGATDPRPLRFVKNAFLAQAFLFSLLAVFSLENDALARIGLQIAAATGIAGYLYFYVDWKLLRLRLMQMLGHSLSDWKGVFRSQLSDFKLKARIGLRAQWAARAAWELNAVRELVDDGKRFIHRFRKTCSSTLAELSLTFRPSR